MAWLLVDGSRCTGCGLCKDDCPMSDALFIEGGVPIEENSAFCLHCGHCAAICPEEAITLDGVDPENLVDLSKELMPGFDAVSHLMSTRRSTRAFNGRPLPKETVEELLAVAANAPTGMNARPVKWLVLESEEAKRAAGDEVAKWMAGMSKVEGNPYADFMGQIVSLRKKGIDRIFYDAPAIVIAYAHEKSMSPLVNAAIALTYLELAAWGRGVGSCWAGFLHWCASSHPPMAEVLGTPEGHAIQGALMLGYPARNYTKIPVRETGKIIWR